MRTVDYLTIIAIILGPILAVQIEKFLERRRDNKSRKTNIFKTLMATRGSVLSQAHVEALNRIDLEFSDDKKYQKVIEAWKEYFDNLGKGFDGDEKYTIWNARNEELLANLLYEMGQSLGYRFDKVLIKRNIYSPIGHAKAERENEEIRDGLLKILKGETAVPIGIEYVANTPEELERQSQLQALMIQHYQTNKNELEE